MLLVFVSIASWSTDSKSAPLAVTVRQTQFRRLLFDGQGRRLRGGGAVIDGCSRGRNVSKSCPTVDWLSGGMGDYATGMPERIDTMQQFDGTLEQKADQTGDQMLAALDRLVKRTVCKEGEGGILGLDFLKTRGIHENDVQTFRKIQGMLRGNGSVLASIAAAEEDLREIGRRRLDVMSVLTNQSEAITQVLTFSR